jgi:hypothetical protein
MAENVAVRYTARRLTMQGLKPTDYFLYKEGKEFFNFDMRQLVVLGLRTVYAGLHGQITREQILNMAASIYGENMDQEPLETRPTYREFSKIRP